MKPLVVSLLPRPPHSSRDGLAIRNYHLLAALTQEFRVRALALTDRERIYEGEWPPGVRAEIVPQVRRGLRRVLAAASSLLVGGAYSEKLYRSFALSRRLEALVVEEQPRWVVAHSYHIGLSAARAGKPLWIDCHNLDSEIWKRTAETATSRSVRWFARLQHSRVLGVEGTLAQMASGLSCVSERDAEALRAFGGRAVPLVVPNGVDLVRHAFRRERPRGETVLFIGDLSWPPNADGVRWLLSSVWPHVRSRRSGARLAIVGRSAPADVVREGGPDVVFAGEGGDARAYWLEAAVAAVPLLSGGGTRLKILEAAATGVPVVSTRVGAEGLDFADETEILRRDEPEPFADAIVSRLADPEAAGRQAAAARARVEAQYGWGPIGEAFVRALASGAGTR
jgi:glycosyltransferase involved in cell wall biosynthesis